MRRTALRGRGEVEQRLPRLSGDEAAVRLRRLFHGEAMRDDARGRQPLLREPAQRLDLVQVEVPASDQGAVAHGEVAERVQREAVDAAHRRDLPLRTDALD